MYVTPTHDLAQQVQIDLEAAGVSTHYWRQGPSKEDACIKPDEVEFYRGLGYVIRRGPCLNCSKRRECTYRRLFTCQVNQSAQVLIITSWHLRRDDLWSLKPLDDRPLVILDEDALSALAAPVELTVERLQRFLEHFPALCEALNAPGDEEPAGDASEQTADTDVEAALAMAEDFRRMVECLLQACAIAGKGTWRTSESIFEQIGMDNDRAWISDRDAFSAVVQSAYAVVQRGTSLPNMLADLRDLVLEPRPVHLSVGACRWTRQSMIPPDRDVLMLDATAEPSVVEGVLGLSEPIEVITTPAVEQQATIYQVMDRIGTRAANRRDLASEQSWTVQVATEIAQKHAGRALLCVTFKDDEQQLAELMEGKHGNATVIHYGGLRGLNAFENFDAGLIIGRPMPNEAQLQLLAVAAFGREALNDRLEPPELHWRLITRDIGPDAWTIRCQRYDDPRWQAVWRHVVTGELMQAIGRLRPLTNPATVYVLSNEMLPDSLDVTAVYACEIISSLAPLTRRGDFRQRVQTYAEAMAALEAAGEEPTNRAVCATMGIKECNGFRYRKLANEMPRPP